MPSNPPADDMDFVPPTLSAHQIRLVKPVVVRVRGGDIELQELYLAALFVTYRSVEKMSAGFLI